jgi:hypothetical protein
MTSLLEVAAGVRQRLRDFPRYFEISEGPLNTLTIRLPHPLVTATSLQVYSVAGDPVTSALTGDWVLDERNGLLKLTDEALLQSNVVVAGYYHTWFTDSDLLQAAHDVITEVTYDSEDTIDTLSDVETEVVEIGAVVRALWSLSIELALDIDVSTPEGMFIPAHQRYTQVLQMMQHWESEFETKSASLNMGLGKLEQFRLRRVSYTTGRYVPVYRDREFDDPRWPERLYPVIPEGVPDDTDKPGWAKVRDLERLSGHGISYPAATWPAFLGRGDP